MTMQIDPKVPIAGLRASLLKRVFRRNNFNTDWFADRVATQREEAWAKLCELTEGGWIAPDPSSEGWWVTKGPAQRLTVTPLLPRLLVPRAREIVGCVISEAEAINADDAHSYYVAKLVLFGSLLKADEDQTVGDIDLGWELLRREEDVERWRKAYDAEVQLRAAKTSRPPDFYWPSDRILRRLKADPRVSLCPAVDVTILGCPSGTVYEFDIADRRSTVTLPWARPNAQADAADAGQLAG